MKKTSTPSFFKNMSTLKKVLTVFFVLLVFIIIIEQPGSDKSKKDKSAKFFIPKLVIKEVQKIGIQKPNKKEIILEKKDGKWQVNDGRYLPANSKKIEDFLKANHALKQIGLVSKNPNRMSVYSVDEKMGRKIRIWNNKKDKIADFFVGKITKDGQFLRHSNSNSVYETIPSLSAFLPDGAEGWKDKTLLNIDEDKAISITLKYPKKELVLKNYFVDHKSGEWKISKPKTGKIDEDSLKKLFEQLKKFEAKSFASIDEEKNTDFKKPDYKISVRMTDNSMKSISFVEKDEDEKDLYAKKDKSDIVYIVSSDTVDKIFGLEFDPDNESDK
mgnify:CR=1 FL=1